MLGADFSIYRMRFILAMLCSMSRSMIHRDAAPAPSMNPIEGYDADAIRADLAERKIEAVIPADQTAV